LILFTALLKQAKMIKLDMIQTLALAGIVVFIGYFIKDRIKPLARYNLPAPVIGGLVVAVIQLINHIAAVSLFTFDTALQVPLMTAFFTSVGFGSSLRLLKTGRSHILAFLAIAVIFALLQNITGIAVSLMLGKHPLFGVLNSSVTLVGGPATGLAFAPDFEKAGVAGASTIAVASAMTGILCGGIIGAPIGTRLIEKFHLSRALKKERHTPPVPPSEALEAALHEKPIDTPEGENADAYVMLKNLAAILIAMWIGHWISRGFAGLNFKLPGYIGAMLAGSVIRNFADYTGRIRISQKSIDDIGAVSLALFIAMAMMTLRLWDLAGAAATMAAVIAAQVLLIASACFWPLHRLFGRDYEAAVTCAGFCGFMLGTTANAMANMQSLTDRYGPAKRAFLVVPIVGAFFIDVANALIITLFMNIDYGCR
jgi:ESS family glutamate:Na+ symporter